MIGIRTVSDLQGECFDGFFDLRTEIGVLLGELRVWTSA